jgi:hypothetical protein
MAGPLSLPGSRADSSWSNWIESEFAALRYFALNGTDHRSHAEQTGFATDSPIRTWTQYPTKVA